MDKIKRVILLRIPTSVCNFRCHYCYLSQRDVSFQGEQAKMLYTPEQVAYAMRPERIGGLAYLNFCADGETLISKNIDKYIHELVKIGHYAEIVTNLTVTPILERILSWDKEILQRIEFKCSFHYLELKKKGLLQTFADNVNRVWEAGASANIEVTPSDELIPYIDELKTFSLEKFGALPHLTIARNDTTENIDYLTKLSEEEYSRTWEVFNSDFWNFKQSIFKKKVKEFCYAGDWSLYVDLSTGVTTQCYCSDFSQNIFKNPDKPIKFKAIGKCKLPHCYNGHMLVTLGCVPNFTNYRYGDIRDREKIGGGTHWLQPELKSFFNTTLVESNKEYGYLKKRFISSSIGKNVRKVMSKGKRILKRVIKNEQKRD